MVGAALRRTGMGSSVKRRKNEERFGIRKAGVMMEGTSRSQGRVPVERRQSQGKSGSSLQGSPAWRKAELRRKGEAPVTLPRGLGDKAGVGANAVLEEEASGPFPRGWVRQ